MLESTEPLASPRVLPRGRQVDFASLGDPSAWKPEFAVPFNQRMIGSKVLISNDFGDWLLLPPEEFRAFVEGRPRPGEPLYDKLRDANFIAGQVDRWTQADRWRRKKQYLFSGPTLHAFVLTHRCNHGCQYCHSSIVGMERTDTVMSFEVAERGGDAGEEPLPHERPDVGEGALLHLLAEQVVVGECGPEVDGDAVLAGYGEAGVPELEGGDLRGQPARQEGAVGVAVDLRAGGALDLELDVAHLAPRERIDLAALQRAYDGR